jgi:hypothetical protein
MNRSDPMVASRQRRAHRGIHATAQQHHRTGFFGFGHRLIQLLIADG